MDDASSKTNMNPASVDGVVSLYSVTIKFRWRSLLRFVVVVVVVVFVTGVSYSMFYRTATCCSHDGVK